jgi:hypothetical protein
VEAVASFWQMVGFVGGLLLVALALGWWWYRRTRPRRRRPAGPALEPPAFRPRKPNGEDQGH